ncbi:MAG: RNA polymerase sigma factor [Candidatus Paceibacterota bacterium]
MREKIEDTFKKIYENESDAIFRFCLTRVSDRDQALDITQETFMRLWNNMLNEKEILNPRAFLFTITRNLIIDWYRKKKSISLDKIIDESGEKFDLIDSNAINNLELESEGKYALDKISELGETYQTPIYLRFVEDLSPEEIGKILNISANAVSVRINRGLEELRKITGYNKEE